MADEKDDVHEAKTTNKAQGQNGKACGDVEQLVKSRLGIELCRQVIHCSSKPSPPRTLPAHAQMRALPQS